MKFQKFEHFFFIFGSILIVVFNAILVVFIGLVAFGIFKETSIIFFVKRLMSTTVVVGINVLVGKFVTINKRTGWNKRSGGKIEPKYCLIILILLVNFLLSFEF